MPGKPPAKPTRKPSLIVHLGNVGHGRFLGKKTHTYAKRFKDSSFVGIDIAEITPQHKNWKQIRADFATGLKKLENNSADVISSELAVGHYTRGGTDEVDSTAGIQEHTTETIQLVYQKLKQGGKLMLVVHGSGIFYAIKAFARSNFSLEKISVHRLTSRERERTFWTKNQYIIRPIQIVAEK